MPESFLSTFFPNTFRERQLQNQALQQAANRDQALQALQGLTQGRQVPFQAETFGPEDPLQQLQSQGQSGLFSNLPGLINQSQQEQIAGLLSNPATQSIGQQYLGQQLGLPSRSLGLPASIQEFQLLQQLRQQDPTGQLANEFLGIKRERFQKANLGGRDAIIDTLNEFPPRFLETSNEVNTAAADINRSRELGTQAGRLASKAPEAIGKIQTNINNLKEVIRLVGNGANTGPLASRLPSFQQASIELDNVRSRLGLDVVGAVTFGALSEGELQLALSTALPNNLQGPALVQWAQQKIAAQEKLRDYFSRQSVFLSKPGNSIPKFLESETDRLLRQQGITGLDKVNFDEKQELLRGLNGRQRSP